MVLAHPAGAEADGARCGFHGSVEQTTLRVRRPLWLRDLRQRWGGSYEANVALANAEAKRVFEVMPKSITGGLDYSAFCRASGMANNRAIVLQFLERARARQKGAK
jgi:hypothetical protein